MIILLKAHPALTDEPTPDQAKAGNYKKPRIQWNGLEIAIENPAGSIRRGQDRTGKPWEIRLKFDYGYICRSEGVDGDKVDVLLGPDLSAPFVYVVHQRKYGDWSAYDEDKCLIGFDSEASAKAAFLSNYSDPRFLGPMTAMSVDEFIAKVKATREKPQMIKSVVLFFKSHVRGHYRTINGKQVYVPPYENKKTRKVKLIAKPKGKDRATEDMFDSRFSGDLYDPSAVKELRKPNDRKGVVKKNLTEDNQPRTLDMFEEDEKMTTQEQLNDQGGLFGDVKKPETAQDRKQGLTKLNPSETAKKVIEWKAKRSKDAPISSPAGWIGGWAHENGVKISDADEVAILGEIKKQIGVMKGDLKSFERQEMQDIKSGAFTASFNEYANRAKATIRHESGKFAEIWSNTPATPLTREAIAALKKVGKGTNGKVIVSDRARGVSLVIDKEFYDKIQAGITAKQAEIDARPDRVVAKLIDQRKRLAEEVGYIIEAAHEDHVSRVEHMSEHGWAPTAKRDYETKEKAAREALARFDAEHPEIIAKIKADKKADIERHFWD